MLFKFAQDIEISTGSFIYGGKKRNDNLAQKSVGRIKNYLIFYPSFH